MSSVKFLHKNVRIRHPLYGYLWLRSLGRDGVFEN